MDVDVDQLDRVKPFSGSEGIVCKVLRYEEAVLEEGAAGKMML